MIEETLRKLEERIRSSERADDGARADLLELVGELRAEFAAVAETHRDDAAAIAKAAGNVSGNVSGSADGEDPAGGVEDSMLEFESAHPRIVGIFHSLMRTLADAGI
jgi:hypothetical protein